MILWRPAAADGFVGRLVEVHGLFGCLVGCEIKARERKNLLVMMCTRWVDAESGSSLHVSIIKRLSTCPSQAHDEFASPIAYVTHHA
jgi:hypothetical protein